MLPVGIYTFELIPYLVDLSRCWALILWAAGETHCDTISLLCQMLPAGGGTVAGAVGAVSTNTRTGATGPPMKIRNRGYLCRGAITK